ncbi:MAG: hypothetical protein AB1486_33130 [Planctomycetota bacterium]
MKARERVVGILVAAAVVIAGFREVASGQPGTPQIVYVNAATGSDLTGNGTQGNPWQSIRYALAQTAGLPWVKIRVLDTAPARHNDAIENWTGLGSLQVPAGTTIEKWLGLAPTIIDGAGVAAGMTPLVVFTSPNGTNISGSNTGLKNLHFYETYTAGQNAVAVGVRGVGAGIFVQPTIDGCVFSRCQTGIHVRADGSYPGTVRPSVSNSSFFNKVDAFNPNYGPKALLNQHVRVDANQVGNQATPTISSCKFYPAPPGSGSSTVGYAVYLRGYAGNTGQPFITDSIFGYANQDASAVLGVGLRSLVTNSGRLDFRLQVSTVRNCKHNGVEIMSHTTRNVASLPVIDRCLIHDNGFGWNWSWAQRHSHDHNWTPPGVVPNPPRGHGVVAHTIEWGQIQPTIQSCTIAYNHVDGVHSLPIGVDSLPTGVSETWVDLKVKHCTIRDNERTGISNIAKFSLATATVYNNRIYDNAAAGVFNSGEWFDYVDNQEQILAEAKLWNNVTFQIGGQNYGVVNERWPSQTGGYYGTPAQSHLKMVNDTVAFNTSVGIYNIDPLGNFNEPASTMVWNTISFYNPASADMLGFNTTGQVRYSCYYNASPTSYNKNINVPPQFSDVGGGSYGFHLTYPGSPAVDKASNTPQPLPLPATDFEGHSGSPGRAINKTGAPVYWCDMGADEVL